MNDKVNSSPRNENRRLRVSISAAEVFYNCCIASGNFSAVLMQSLGLSAGSVGLVTSLCSVSGIAAPPIWGAAADKMQSVSKCFLLCLTLSAVMMLLVPLTAASQAAAVLIPAVLVLSALFTGPANNMSELWLVQIGNSGRGISYGSVRLWASLGYAVMSLIYSRVLTDHPVTLAYGLYFVFAVPAVAIASRLVNIPLGKNPEKKRIRLKDMPFKSLLCPAVIFFTLFSCLLNLAGSAKNTFFIYVLNDYGLSSTAIAGFMALSAFLEIPALMISQKVIDRAGLILPIVVCVFAQAAETLLYVIGASVPFIILGQVLKGLSAGLLMSARIQYLWKIAPSGLEATTQTLIGSLSALVNIPILAVSGFLLDAAGVRLFYLILCAAELMSLIMLALPRMKKKNR